MQALSEDQAREAAGRLLAKIADGKPWGMVAVDSALPEGWYLEGDPTFEPLTLDHLTQVYRDYALPVKSRDKLPF